MPNTNLRHQRVRFGMLFALGLLSALLTGCRQVSLNYEAAKTEKIVKEVTNESIPLLCSQENIEEILSKEVTRDEAIRIALLNNKALHASFQELGIAKADLVQAGLFKNPSAATSFNIPRHTPGIVTNIELEAPIISLTELWQVPLRKRVFSEQLEGAMFRFVHLLFDTMVNARKAYDKVLFTQALLKNTRETWMQIKALRDDIFDRQYYGFTSDLDKHLVEVTAGEWNLKVTILEAEVANAFTELRYVLGLDPASSSLMKLAGALNVEPAGLPELGSHLDWAVHNHPEIRLTHKKVAYYTNLVTYEKSRMFKEVDIGVAFKQDFDPQQRGIGPYLNAEIPLFDQNQARIAHAEYNLKKAEWECSDIQLRIKSQVISQYNNLAALTSNIALYQEKIFVSNQKALDYTVKFQRQMQITIPTLLLTQTALYKTQRKLLRTYYKALNAYSELERAVGKRLSSFKDIKDS